ncbi:MAG: RsfS/YbeB/iojap family protein, partial [Clostridia bacterium]|nr:RsfS/YbeB/iojap family protein [Clostridia bacterium]
LLDYIDIIVHVFSNDAREYYDLDRLWEDGKDIDVSDILPGSSNALAISRRLGLKESILNDALASLSEDGQKFERIVRSAEESRIRAEETFAESNRLRLEWQEKLQLLETEREKLKKEKEKLFTSAKAESRRIINERTATAEELLHEIEDIFAKESISEADLIKARTLKNKLGDAAYESENEESERQYLQLNVSTLKVGDKVFVKNIGQEGIVQNIRLQKGEAEVLCGNMRVRSKITDLAGIMSAAVAQNKNKSAKWQSKNKNEKVQVKKSLQSKPAPTLEINVIGLTVHEALPEVEAFIDSAVIANLEEVRVVHGVGTGKLRAGIHDFLRKHRNVESYRLGKYGEGETGVTIIKIK